MLSRYAIAAVLAGSAFVAPSARAQGCDGTTTCTATNTSSLTIGPLVNLTMSSATTTLTPPTKADFVAGYVANAGPTFVVQSNEAWTLSIKAAASNGTNWTYTGTKGGVRAIGSLTWSSAVGGTFAAMTGADIALATAAAATDGTAAAVFFRTTYAPEYSVASNRAGVYTLPIEFTLSAP
jgi:hypothetical protein